MGEGAIRNSLPALWVDKDLLFAIVVGVEVGLGLALLLGALFSPLFVELAQVSLVLPLTSLP